VRIQLEIDALIFQIETRDPETMARWLVEWFAEIQRLWTPATHIRIMVYPSYSLRDTGKPFEFDWIANASLNGPISGKIHTPAQFVRELGDRLADLGADK
jgi:hypothetical protein